MSYKIEKFFVEKRVQIFKFLMETFNVSISDAQRMIDKRRVIYRGEVLMKKSFYIKGEIEVIVFVPKSRGLNVVFETNEFAIFDKPTGVLIHPSGRDTEYSLTHEVKYKFGMKANITHRIDKETSGVVLISKNKKSESLIKMMFENREIKKGYLALVRGEIKDEIVIDEPLMKNSDFSVVKLKMFVHPDGKKSKTIVKPIKYDSINNQTLVEVLPLTGRQHQIRVHLFHVKHPIVGDPLYGVDSKIATEYLEGVLSDENRIKHTHGERLMLHANWLEFNYDSRHYKLYSKGEYFI
jgi:23S rRNA pseudouridine1911/1915/1917 synthase